MMEKEIGLWINTLFVSGCILSVILYLSPNEKSRSILEIGCSCVMIFALVIPLNGLRLNDCLNEFKKFQTTIENELALKEISSDALQLKIIEKELEEYILNEAERYPISLKTVTVTVLADESEQYAIESISYDVHDAVPYDFLVQMKEQLGVPIERQIVYEHSRDHQENP